MPVADASIDNHTAAQAIIALGPPPDEIYEFITVVLGPEWNMIWAIIGSTPADDPGFAGPRLNMTTETFDVLPPSSSSSFTPFLVAGVVVAVAVAVAVGLVLFTLLRRKRRRSEPPIPGVPPGPPPSP
jgi:hypothetical protein